MQPNPAGTPPLSDVAFHALTTILERQTGIRLAKDKRGLVVSRLMNRLRARGVESFGDYLTLLEHPSESAEVEQVVDALTTHETFFFREPRHFEVLAETVANVRPRPPVFRVWSAAASTGEEAYSAAMQLAASLPLSKFEVVGTDVSAGVVASAQRGVFPLARGERLPQAMLRQWCRRGTGQWEGMFLIAPELRQTTRFQVGNLFHPQGHLGAFDFIFLRNVLIYFDPAQQQVAIRSVVDRLRPGGVLVVGHSESANGVSPLLETIEPSVYRRRVR